MPVAWPWAWISCGGVMLTTSCEDADRCRSSRRSRRAVPSFLRAASYWRWVSVPVIGASATHVLCEWTAPSCLRAGGRRSGTALQPAGAGRRSRLSLHRTSRCRAPSTGVARQLDEELRHGAHIRFAGRNRLEPAKRMSGRVHPALRYRSCCHRTPAVQALLPPRTFSTAKDAKDAKSAKSPGPTERSFRGAP